MQWEQWFLTLRPISTLGAVIVLNIPSIWSVGINDLYLRECEKSHSETDLAIHLRFSWRRARTVPSECSRPYWCLHNPTANFLPRLQISSVQWSDLWNVQSLLSSKDEHTSDLNINRTVGNIQLSEGSGNWKLRSHFPETSRGMEHPPSRGRVLKDGSSQHAAHQQGVKRNTETNHGLGCSLHLHQLLEQHLREAVLQRGLSSSAQLRLPELRNTARAVGA